VTIGITAFNAADTIERAVRSALAQNWLPIEIVVVDDCSSDETYGILNRLAAAHPEVRVFQNPGNGGVAVSRNHILAEAKGGFVAFFDDDDESLPDRISIQYARIISYEHDFAAGALVICHTARTLFYPDGSERIDPTMGEREERLAPHGPAVAERVLLGTALEDGYGACPTCSQMARLTTYQNVGGFDPTFRRSEDTELNIRLAKEGGHFIGIAMPLVRQTMTKTNDKSLADERYHTHLLLNKHRDVADRYGMYNFCQRWIDIKYQWLEGRKFSFAFALMGQVLAHPWLVYRRLMAALPNIGLNKAFSRFHGWRKG